MSFAINQISDKKIWDEFLNQEQPCTFLQSWAWGEFNQALGDKIWRLGIFTDGAFQTEVAPIASVQSKTNIANSSLLAIALIIKIKARRGSFLFCPHGPVAPLQFKVQSSKFKVLLKCLITYLKSLAQKENCGFIRISSLLENNEENQKLFKNLGFRRAPIHMHSERAWILNLKEKRDSNNQPANLAVASENFGLAEFQAEFFARLRKTHRNLIRKAQHLGVEIIQSNKIADLIIFDQIYRATVKRQKFTPFSFEYLKKEFEIFQKENKALIFLARFKGRYLSGAIIIFDTNAAFYHHGASARDQSNIPASYLLQWSAILEAAWRGLQFYNFWGIAPAGAKNHPWAGLTLFKQGFGGFSQEYLPAQDLVLKYSYWLTYVIEKIRKWKRGL